MHIALLQEAQAREAVAPARQKGSYTPRVSGSSGATREARRRGKQPRGRVRLHLSTNPSRKHASGQELRKRVPRVLHASRGSRVAATPRIRNVDFRMRRARREHRYRDRAYGEQRRARDDDRPKRACGRREVGSADRGKALQQRRLGRHQGRRGKSARDTRGGEQHDWQRHPQRRLVRNRGHLVAWRAEQHHADQTHEAQRGQAAGQRHREALDLAVVELVRRDDGRMEERPAPPTLRSDEVIVLDVYGSLFYAGARTLQALLPDPTGTHAPGVVLRLRGRTTFGATFFVILANYAKRISDVGGTLVLSGVGEEAAEQLRRTRVLDTPGHTQVFPATPMIGESTLAAYEEARRWLIVHRSEPPQAP